MARVDPLQSAAASYTADQWTQEEWRQFGRETGTSDILNNHPRLYRSQDFGDDDYLDAASDVLKSVLREGVEAHSGERGRMAILADSMPDLPNWVESSAPTRIRRLFDDYIAGRDVSEIPAPWIRTPQVSKEFGEQVAYPFLDRVTVAETPVKEVSVRSERNGARAGHSIPAAPDTRLFIVHGHDAAARDSIRIYVHKLTGLMPVSLAEEAGGGDTIIEKFEKHGTASSFVIVLLSPDDVGQSVVTRDAGEPSELRARQNVILELGYFIGKIGREKIVVIDAGIEMPSDLNGLGSVNYPGDNWKDDLRVELVHAGLIS